MERERVTRKERRKFDQCSISFDNPPFHFDIVDRIDGLPVVNIVGPAACADEIRELLEGSADFRISLIQIDHNVRGEQELLRKMQYAKTEADLNAVKAEAQDTINFWKKTQRKIGKANDLTFLPGVDQAYRMHGVIKRINGRISTGTFEKPAILTKGTRLELRKQAQLLRIPGAWNMSKAELETNLERVSAGLDPLPPEKKAPRVVPKG